MAALFFPNPSALRLALTSGLVPSEMARAPAAAGFDSHGRLWLELPHLLPRECLAALHRFGVQALGKAGVGTQPVRCWAELLSLTPDLSSAPGGRVLLVVPDYSLARLVARLRRSTNNPLAIALVDHMGTPCSWVAISRPPAALLAETAELDSPVESFTEQSPGVWARFGWKHPLPDQLVAPVGHVLLLRPPRDVAAVAGSVPQPCEEEFLLAAPRGRLAPRTLPTVVIPVRPRLVRRQQPEKESLWVLDQLQARSFWSFCATADERLIRRLEVASVARGNETRLVVRTTGKRPSLVLPFAVTGHAAEPRIPGLFLPALHRLQPILRASELSRLFHLAADRLVWLEPAHNGSVTPHAIPLSAFRPVAERLEYTVTAIAAMAAPTSAEVFPLAKWPVIRDDRHPDSGTRPSPLSALAPGIEEYEEASAEEQCGPGWIRRSLQKLAGRFSPRRPRPSPNSPPGEPTTTTSTGAGRRVERKLASPDTLLHGHDWTARRRGLETRLFRELPTLGPDGRAPRWAELADVYSASGNATDAAVCWMNAVWEAPAPALSWLEQWFAAECRAAKFTDQSGGLDRWLGETGRPGAARVVAAYTAWAGFSPTPPAEFPGALARILVYLDQHFDDLPVRAAWLARRAATQLCDGDVLGLARWHDRVLARLADRGPGLDLDEPSFLRFHGTASADRFETAREWLIRMRDPAVAWVQRHGNGGRLRSVGLDAETEATAAYAQFMLAWGLGCLGERTLARDWAARAHKRLARYSGPGIDPAAHALLSDLFLHRVKDAQEGRPAKLGLPADIHVRLDTLASLTRYSVDRLREHSRILEPLDRVRAYRGVQLKRFWGNDQLAERLFVLTERADPANVADECEALLRLCAENPGTTTVPRIVLTLLEVAPWLDPGAFLRVVDLLPTAIEWMESWLAGGPWSESERADCVIGYQGQMIEAACTTAGALAPGLAAPAVSQLIRQLLARGIEVRRPFLGVAGMVFRCLRRLKLSSEAEALMEFLDPGGLGTAAEAGLPAITRLGLATGWFTSGNEDAGNRILNEARESLFLTEDRNPSERTELAIAYAEALGFAPPRIAHGRLEELFQRPRFLVEVKGSTNRYFTLKPLQLIDTIIRSVVTDDFTLGPAVRGWLDDDEFLIRGRIHRDLALVLREQGMG